MHEISQICQDIKKLITESTGKITSLFMEVNDQLKNEGYSGESAKQFDRLFKNWIKSNKSVSEGIERLIQKTRKVEEYRERIEKEKKRLETLYTSGIIFSSETEMKSLMGKAIDITIKELNADAGFILLTNKNDKIESIFARNMNPDDDPDATQMSLSVIKNTVTQSRPVQINNIDEYLKSAQHSSILRLGIQTALCVPLLLDSQEGGGKALGAVYLDRRKQKQPFNENDLVFLLSFARQIVQGIKVSQEFSILENKILSDEKLRFEDLRKEFDCHEIIGSSQSLFHVLKTAAKIAPTTASAIILGENGTGKELLARAIHHNSRRKDQPFVAIDCSAIPKDLLESELFGYEAGAFTGATKTKPGKVELADGGTLFLDEIGELNINLQAKLLRVLQTHEVERLGSVKKQKVDLRIIAATNRDIAKMIEGGTFREDLYYRLKVIELIMPPLRERKEDIAELAKHFLEKHCQGSQSFGLSNDALEILEHYTWPGNIRELENVILRCIVLAKDKFINPEDLPSEIIDDPAQDLSVVVGKSLVEAEKEFRKMYILKTLRQTSSKTEAAKLLGINRTHFHRVLSGLGIE